MRNSTLAPDGGAGRGLFARRDLPKGAVLPPYAGQLLTYREVGVGKAECDMQGARRRGCRETRKIQTLGRWEGGSSMKAWSMCGAR